MKRVGWEWRKLLTLPALWGFLALCLVFNGLLMANAPGDRQTFGEISATARALGQRVDQDFVEGLAQRPATSVQEALSQVTGEMTNIYADYDLSGLVTRYQQLLSASPTASAWMTAKYQALEQRVDHLAQTGAAMDLYAGPMTHDSHQFLFGTLMRAMVGEGAVLGMLAALYLLGYEKVHRTEGMVYTTSTGRNMLRGKIVAAVTAGMALYLLLTGLTLGIYFVQWDYSGLWSASVSSQFNFLTDMMVRRPFLTWADFTVAQYLVACLALGGRPRGGDDLAGGPMRYVGAQCLWGGAGPHVGLFGLSGAPSAFGPRRALGGLLLGWLSAGGAVAEQRGLVYRDGDECHPALAGVCQCGGDVPVGRRGTLGGLPPVS